MDVPMTPAAKYALKDAVQELTREQQNGILKIVRSCIPDQKAKGDVFEFELDNLSVRKCRELEKFVEHCKKENLKKAKRKEADKKRREKKNELKKP